MSRTFFKTGSRWSRLWPSDRAHIVEAPFLEQGAVIDHEAAGIFLDAGLARSAISFGRCLPSCLLRLSRNER